MSESEMTFSSYSESSVYDSSAKST